MSTNRQLQEAYRSLLKKHGLPVEVDGPKTSKRDVISLLERMVDQVGPSSPWRGWSRDSLEQYAADFAQGGHSPNVTIQARAAEVQKAAEALGRHLPLPAYAGVFPTRFFNAEAMPIPEGATQPSGVLILVNTGLMTFLADVVKVLSLCIRFSDPSVPRDGRSSTSWGDSGSSFEETAHAMTGVIVAYLSFELYGIPASRSLPPPSADKIVVSGLLLRAIERFVIAHEYGHLISGHFTSPKYVRRSTMAGDIKFFAKDFQDEYEADRVAFALMLASTHRVVHDQLQWFEVLNTVAAPLVFFAIEEVINRVADQMLSKRGGAPLATTHPCPASRARAAMEFFEPLNDGKLLELSNAYLQICRDLAEAVTDNVRRSPLCSP